MDRTAMITRLQSNRHLLDAYAVRKISIIASVLQLGGMEAGDVDLLVEFDASARVGMFRFANLRRELSELLECNVDLATPDALPKAVRRTIIDEAIHAA